MDLRQLPQRHDRLRGLAPRRDGETLATAGVLQWAARLGAETRVVFMTDGENNPWAQRATERRWRITRQDQLRWGARRRREAIRALTCLGLRPDRARFLGLPDQLLTESLTADPEGSTRMLVDELRSWNPTLLFAPSFDDHHPDHGTTAVLTQLALAQCRHHPRLFEYAIHPARRRPPGERAWHLVLSRGEREIKRRAVLHHSSQLRLRRGLMLRFVDEPERFGVASTARTSDQPLRLLRSTPGEISFVIRRSLRVALGGVALLLVTASEDGASILRVKLAQRQGQYLASGADGRELDSKVTTLRNGSYLHVTVSAPCLREPDRCLAKLDASRERNLGFFDPWPWLSLGLASRAANRSR